MGLGKMMPGLPAMFLRWNVMGCVAAHYRAPIV